MSRHDQWTGVVLGLGCLLMLLTASIFADESAEIGPQPADAELVATLRTIIGREMSQKGLPALSIALVDGDRLVWAAGFGQEDPGRRVPATAQTVYRVGSVSKLVTALAVMQLVEQGRLKLDEPVTTYLPDFQPRNSFDKPVTLRQLMSHRAGLVRESPVGSYFDAEEPSLADTVRSLNDTALPVAPESKTKYSNAGVAGVGRVVERVVGRPFDEHVADTLLRPLGMSSSGFERTDAVNARLAKAIMWTYDGRTFDAPPFRLGTSPAGNLYASVTDLARLQFMLFHGGAVSGRPGSRVLAGDSLDQMWKPQFTDKDEGFGLGFFMSKLDGQRRISHGGAVYGFATQFVALPDRKLGVAIATTRDCSNGWLTRLGDHALRLMLARRDEKKPPDWQFTGPVPSELAARLRGRWSDGDKVLEIVNRPDRVWLWRGEYRREVRATADGFTIDDVFGFGPKIELRDADTLVVDDKTFRRQPDTRPAEPPRGWLGLIGEYGWDHNTLFIHERDGKLYALIEWLFDYPLTELNDDEFAFPDFGMYHDEKLIFRRDPNGRASEVVAASVRFPRRTGGPHDGDTFRIRPVRPVDELRLAALAAKAPVEPGEFRQPDLVELTKLDPTIRLDIRYATTNNFAGSVFYSEPRAFLQRPAAEAVAAVHRWLKEQGYGLLIHDGYRPWYVTKMFFDATPDELKQFVADPAKGSRHNRGCAVDLTLFDLQTGQPVEMPSGYDEFTPRAFPDYPGGTSRQKWRRELLRDAMSAAGFDVYEFEWWHFDFRDWRKYPILNVRFDQIGTQR